MRALGIALLAGAACLGACAAATPAQPHATHTAATATAPTTPASTETAAPLPSKPVDFAAVRAELQLGARAHDAHDYAAFAQHADRAVGLAPRSPATLYTLACARALLRDAKGAAELLQRVASMTVYFDVAGDPDFDAVRSAPEVAAAREALEALETRRIGASEPAFSVPEKDLLTEGLAYDPASGAFFLSSVHHRKIVRVAKDGTSRDFVAEGQDGIWGVLALAVDAKRAKLLALSLGTEEMLGFRKEDAGLTGLFEYELGTGKLARKIVLDRPAGEATHALNDLVLDSRGTAYVSDARSGAVLVLPVATDRFDVLVPPGTLPSPQGLAFTPDEKTLFVADYSRGVARVDVATGSTTFLPWPEGFVLGGIDALVADGARLIATQNGIKPHRVIALTPNAALDGWSDAAILEMNHPLYREPTLGVVVGRSFYYVANSQWGSFDKDGVMWPLEKLTNPTVLRLPL